MANSKRRTSNYTPRMSDFEAYDLLGPRVRKALQESVNDWGAYWCYRMVKKYGADFVIDAIERGNVDFMKKGFIPKRGRGTGMPSTFTACKVGPLRANW